MSIKFKRPLNISWVFSQSYSHDLTYDIYDIYNIYQRKHVFTNEVPAFLRKCNIISINKLSKIFLIRRKENKALLRSEVMLMYTEQDKSIFLPTFIQGTVNQGDLSKIRFGNPSYSLPHPSLPVPTPPSPGAPTAFHLSPF